MSKSYPDPKVMNLGSNYQGWIADLKKIIFETGRKELYEKSASGIPWIMMKKRLKELKYVCLIDSLTFSDIRTITNCDFEEDMTLIKLEDMFKKMELEVKRVGLYEEEIDDKPCYNYLEEIIIDAFGIYTTSLHGVLKKLISESSASAEVITFEKVLVENPSLDGPAILLCPEKIESIYPKINKVFSEEYPLGANPHYAFFKMTYLHELGHHIYPSIRKNKYVWEALANFFAFGFLNPTERTLLFSKTLTQSYQYQSYCGLLFILYPQASPELNSDFRSIFQLAANAQYFIEKVELSIFERGVSVYDEFIIDLLLLIHRMFYHKKEVIYPVKGCVLFLADLFRQTNLFDFMDIVSVQKKNHTRFSDPKITWDWNEKVNQYNRLIIR